MPSRLNRTLGFFTQAMKKRTSVMTVVSSLDGESSMTNSSSFKNSQRKKQSSEITATSSFDGGTLNFAQKLDPFVDNRLVRSSTGTSNRGSGALTSGGQHLDDPRLPDVEEQDEEGSEPWVEWVNKGDCAWAKGRLGLIKAFNHVCLSPDEAPMCGVPLVSVSCSDGCVSLYDATSMLKIYSFSGHSESINCTAFNNDCTLVASCSDDCSLRVWRPPDYDNTNRKVTGKGVCTSVCRGHPQQGLSGHSQPVTRCEFSPDGNSLVSSSDDRTIKTWDPLTGHLQHTLVGHTG